MRRQLNFRLATLVAIVVSAAASHLLLFGAGQRGNRTVQLIPHTNLKIEMPPDWRINLATSPPVMPLGPPQLEHIGKPAYALTISQTTSRTTQHSCVNLIGGMNTVPSLAS